MSKILPMGLKRALKAIETGYERRTYRNELERKKFTPAPTGSVQLSYGGVLPSEPGAIVSGGRVKLLELNRIYPETDESFNVLYLVSSALPPYVEELINWAKDNAVKIVWNQNGVAYPAWAGARYSDINEPMKYGLHRADHVFYQSEFCKLGSDRYLDKVDCTWDVAYNYVDTPEFKPGDAVIPGDTWRILSAGTHQKSYRLLSCLYSLKELINRGRAVKLVIAGRMDFPGADTLVKEEINKLGIENNIELIGSYTRSEAVALFQESHILLHTKYNDPCPTVPIEAMSCGVPVVGSNSGGMPELVSEDSGVLIEAPLDWEMDHAIDAFKAADAIEKIMSEYESYSENARSRAIQRFDKSVWLDKHREIFERLIFGV